MVEGVQKMKNRIVTILALAVLASFFTGCQQNQTLLVDRTDAGELEAVSQFAAKHEDYRHWLAVLEHHYKRSDNMDKLLWARQELSNLAQADKTFSWSWSPEVTPPPAEDLVDRDEGVLIEYAISSRNEYFTASDNLEQFYATKPNAALSLDLVRQMRKKFCHVKTYAYDFNAEIPGPLLRPTEVDPEASRLYEKAMSLHKRGSNLILTPYHVTRKEMQEEAVMCLLKLVREHPKAKEIALSAYFIAEIYKDYFDENFRAVKWYERAWQWDSELPKPARFQAATVYDAKLKSPAKAIELYKASRKLDPYRVGNDNWARKRIEQILTSDQ